MKCKKCGENKRETEFNETSFGVKIERITMCKYCQSGYSAIWYRANKERVLHNQRCRRAKQKRLILGSSGD